MAKVAKREAVERNNNDLGVPSDRDSATQAAPDRRVLRSRYLAVKNLINDEREDISKVDSGAFNTIIKKVESLHQLVQKPREQVADAEALLDIANTLVMSVKSQGKEGVSLSDFITSLIQNFGRPDGGSNTDNVQTTIAWSDIGIKVSNIFKTIPGCCTMLGPMDTEWKPRKVSVQKKRMKPTESVRPEELEDTGKEKKTDTDKNMTTMFEILRKKRKVRLENLVLNRESFAQTVENVFALSFLAKDGRAEITVDDNGHHLVAPRNAPSANSIASGEVYYSHFVFRFDFKDWKLMKDSVIHGEELMPSRKNASDALRDPAASDSHVSGPATPIRKLTRNHGLVIQDEILANDTPEKEDKIEEDDRARRRGKRRLY